MHQKIPYIARLRHLETHTDTVDSVPHELTPQQTQHRVDICHQLIGNPMDGRFTRRIVTCDEKWVYYRNPDTSKQCLSPRQPAKVIFKKICLTPQKCCVSGGIWKV